MKTKRSAAAERLKKGLAILFALPLALAGAGPGPGAAQLSSPGAAGPAFEGGQASRAERRLGPFTVGAKEFTVLLRLRRIEGAPDGFEETVESLAIVDGQSREHYQKNFRVEVGESMFTETVGVTAVALERPRRVVFPAETAGPDERVREEDDPVGLLIYYGYIPSAPNGGMSVQAFRLAADRLTPSSAPLTLYGRIHDLEAGRRPGTKKLGPGGTMEFGVWTGWFEVIVPVRVLEGLGIVPLHHHQTYGLDAFAVAAEREPPGAETFVRLFRTPDDTAPDHVIVRKGSAVEFLMAYAKASLEAGEEEVSVSVEEKPWLKVRIDGREGYVKDEEDLTALGLRPAG